MGNYKILKVLFLFIGSTLLAQTQQPKINFKKDDFSQNWYDSIRQTNGKKTVPPIGAENAFYLALAHYPEIKNQHIVCKYRKSTTPLMVKPKTISCFIHKKEDRRYKLLISNNNKELDSLILLKQSFNAQVGVLGHELAHIAYYKKNGFRKLIGMSISMLSSKYINKLEFETDQATIDHGLGWQLLEWSSISGELIGEKYLSDIPNWKEIDFQNLPFELEERYMFPWTIKEKIATNPLYNKDYLQISIK